MTRLTACILLILLASQKISIAQIDDTRSRHRIGVHYDITKKLGLYVGYRLDTEHNLTTFRKSNFDLELDYRIKKWVEGIFLYRFTTTHDGDYHRMRAGLKFYYEPYKKWTLSYRTLVQHDIDYWDAEYFATYNPKWVWRNKVALQYDINKKLDIAVFDELFANRYKMENYFYRNRAGLDIGYRINKKHKLALGYFLQHNFNTKNPSTTQSFYTNYTFYLKASKKKVKVPKTRIRV